MGRTANNDLVIPHSSVSKLHAHFLIADGADTSVGMQLVDAGSSNGTSVDGRAVDSEQPTDVRAGRMLRFGDVGLVLVDASILHKRLLRF